MNVIIESNLKRDMSLNICSAQKLDIVGSFLLPDDLVEARMRYAAGTMDRQHFNEAEDWAVARLVEDQIKAGLPEVTSGEFRRCQWDKDFWFGFDGICCERIESGHIYEPLDPFTDVMRFSDRIAFNPEHPFFDDFTYLKNIAGGRVRCRQTFPSPANLYLEILSMSDGHPEQLYPSADTLLDDIASAYSKTIRHFYELGCRHVQLDDTACGMLCDDNYTKRLLQGGVDLLALHEQIIGLFNKSIADLPSDMELSLYLSGGDTVEPEWEFLQFPDNIMPKVLSRVDVSKFFMPFDTGNEYQFEVLRHIPDGKNVVLGLVDAHSPLRESPDAIRNAIIKASKYISPEYLYVSPRTGFKLSSYLSRGLTYDSQWKKLELLKTALSQSED